MKRRSSLSPMKCLKRLDIHSRIFLEWLCIQISGLDVIECGQNGKIGDKIAQDVRYGAFCGNSFFYRRRSSDEIIRFDLESKKEAVVRKKKYKEHVQYNRIFTVDNKLYYELEGEIYLYDEAGNDVKIVKEEKE